MNTNPNYLPGFQIALLGGFVMVAFAVVSLTAPAVESGNWSLVAVLVLAFATMGGLTFHVVVGDLDGDD